MGLRAAFSGAKHQRATPYIPPVKLQEPTLKTRRFIGVIFVPLAGFSFTLQEQVEPGFNSSEYRPVLILYVGPDAKGVCWPAVGAPLSQ